MEIKYHKTMIGMIRFNNRIVNFYSSDSTPWAALYLDFFPNFRLQTAIRIKEISDYRLEKSEQYKTIMNIYNSSKLLKRGGLTFCADALKKNGFVAHERMYENIFKNDNL